MFGSRKAKLGRELDEVLDYGTLTVINQLRGAIDDSLAFPRCGI